MRIRIHYLPDEQPQEPQTPATNPQDSVRPSILRLYAGLTGAGIIWVMPQVIGWQGMQAILAAAGVIGLAWALRRVL